MNIMNIHQPAYTTIVGGLLLGTQQGVYVAPRGHQIWWCLPAHEKLVKKTYKHIYICIYTYTHTHIYIYQNYRALGK